MSPKAKFWLGTTIAVLCGLVLVPFVLLLPYHAYTSYKNPGFFDDILGWFFAIGIFLFAFHYGVCLRKKGRWESGAMSRSGPGADELKFNSSVTLNEYRYLMVSLVFTNPFILYIVFIGLFMFLLTVSVDSSSGMNWIGLFLFLLPVGVFFSAGLQYSRTPALKDEVIVIVNGEGIDFNGSMYRANYKWSSIVRIKEISRWFLLYISPQVAIPLKKATLDVDKFRIITKSVPGLIVDLKR